MAAEQGGDELALVRMLREQNNDLDSENRLLKRSGPGGTSGGMDTVDAKIAAAEARTDTKFAELRGDLQRFATTGTVWKASATTAATVITIILAVIAFGGDRFDAGMGASSTVQSVLNEQKQRDAAQDAKLDEILNRLPASEAPSKAKP